MAVGDIHGCYDKLVRLMKKLDFRPDVDTLVFLGDYVDRGEQTADVVQYVMELSETSGGVVPLKGNHEQLFLSYLAGREEYAFLLNGGVQTLSSYGGAEGIPTRHKQFIEGLKNYYETQDYIFVHAGLRPETPLDRQTAQDMLWIRADFIHSDHNHGKRVVFGHTPMVKPLVAKNKIGIDTGAVFGGKLTCLILPEIKFIQV